LQLLGFNSVLVLTKKANLYLIVPIKRLCIRSKKALGRPKDKAVIEILEKTLDEKKKNRKKQLTDLKKESKHVLVEQIRRQLALPMNRRTHFLRKRLPGGGSCL